MASKLPVVQMHDLIEVYHPISACVLRLLEVVDLLQSRVRVHRHQQIKKQRRVDGHHHQQKYQELLQPSHLNIINALCQCTPTHHHTIIINAEIKSDSAPAENLVVFEVVVGQDRLQLPSDVVVVRLGVELQVSHVLKQAYELRRDLVAKGFRCGHEFLVEDLFVLFFFVLGVHVLPGQLPEKEVDEHVDHALEVVSSALLDAEMRINRGISGRSR